MLLSSLPGGGGSPPVVTQLDAFLSGVEGRDNLRVAVLGDGPLRRRGLVTNVDLKAGQRILAVPKSLLMTSHSAVTSPTPLGRLLLSLQDALPSKILLALHLLHESLREDASPWAPYLAMLPARAELSHLQLFSEGELAQLQCAPGACPVLAKMHQLRDELRSVFETLAASQTLQAVFEGRLEWPGFEWAYLVVTSRSFSMNVTRLQGFDLVDSQVQHFRPTHVIAPFADMFNHHNSVPALQHAYGYNDSTACLEVFADQDYPAGSEVRLSYGILTNPDLMLHYGFVLPNNIYETVGFRIDTADGRDDVADTGTEGPGERRLRKLRGRLLAHHRLVKFGEGHVALSGVPPVEFVAALRIKAYVPETEDGAGADGPLPLIDPFAPINAANEFEVWQGLLANVEQLLRSYPTSLVEDLELLGLERLSANPYGYGARNAAASAALSPRARLAVTMRVEIKRILHAMILNCFQGIRGGFELVEKAAAANNQVAEDVDPRSGPMWEHWRNGTASWDLELARWKRDLDMVWGADLMKERQETETALGAVSDLRSRPRPFRQTMADASNVLPQLDASLARLRDARLKSDTVQSDILKQLLNRAEEM